MKIIDANINDIINEHRVSRTNAYLYPLERSIESLGVLHPIGITADNRLIYGGRRLQACKNLKMSTIPAVVIDVNEADPAQLLKMERDENEQRLEMTVSEKTEIARRIEEAIGNRQGQRTDILLPQNIAEVQTGESRDIAAKAVGWNRETYRQAKAVVDSGEEEVIQQMDSGNVSISKAYNEVKRRPTQRTFQVTLFRSPSTDAEAIMIKAGTDYCTKLGIALLQAAGHTIKDII